MPNFKEYIIPALKKYKEDKEREGLVPTIELLISELEEDGGQGI